MGFRAARVRAGLTMEEAANSFGVSRNMVWLWENGRNKPRSDKLVQIAKTYGCTTDELLKEEST